jgi:hypothetical protein
LFLLAFKELFIASFSCLSSEEVRIIEIKTFSSTSFFATFFLNLFDRLNGSNCLFPKAFLALKLRFFQPRRSEEVRIIGIQKLASTLF